MGRSESALGFRLMCYTFKIRDFLFPRITVLNEAGIESGNVVLDYGCGAGSYILPLLSIIGNSGTIYALDRNPMAIQFVENISQKHNLKNVKTILSACNTGLPNESIDVVLLYDIFHHLHNPNEILKELHRVLKPNGILSLSDHHAKDADIQEYFRKNNLFKFKEKNKKTYTLLRIT